MQNILFTDFSLYLFKKKLQQFIIKRVLKNLFLLKYKQFIVGIKHLVSEFLNVRIIFDLDFLHKCFFTLFKFQKRLIKN